MNNEFTEKILFGIEKICQINRVLQWDITKLEQISPIQIQFIETIARMPHEWNTITHLAREFNLKKSTVSESIQNLEKKSILTRHVSPVDRRQIYFALTELGREKLDTIQSGMALIKETISHLQDDKKQIIAEFLTEILLLMYKHGVIQKLHICLACRNCNIMHDSSGTPFGYCTLTDKAFKLHQFKINCHHFNQNPKND